MANPADLLALCASYPVEAKQPGDVLLEEGHRVGVLYILESGQVDILKQEQHINTVAQPGAVFGEISLLLDQAHMATVRVTQPSRFRVIHDPFEFLRRQPEAALHLASLLARRLNAVTTYLVDLKKQYQHHQDHLSMVDEVLEGLLNLQTKPRRRPDPTTGIGP